MNRIKKLANKRKEHEFISENSEIRTDDVISILAHVIAQCEREGRPLEEDDAILISF